MCNVARKLIISYKIFRDYYLIENVFENSLTIFATTVRVVVIFGKKVSHFFLRLFLSRFFAIKCERFRFCPLSRMNGGWNVGMGVPQYNWNAPMGMHNNGWGGAGNMPHRWPPGYRVSDRWIRLRIRILFKLIGIGLLDPDPGVKFAF